MFNNVNISGYTIAENGAWVHFKDCNGRARHVRLGDVYLFTVDGADHLIGV